MLETTHILIKSTMSFGNPTNSYANSLTNISSSSSRKLRATGLDDYSKFFVCFWIGKIIELMFAKAYL